MFSAENRLEIQIKVILEKIMTNLKNAEALYIY